MIVDKIDTRPCWDKGAEIILHTPDISAVKALMDKYVDGKEYVAEIKRKRARRSLDANAYAWTLIGKLAEVLNLGKNEVYKQYITDSPVGVMVPIKHDAVEAWIDNWQKRGLGWICEDMGNSTAKGYRRIFCHYGTSTFNTKEMSHFIDLIVTDCEKQGIETMTPDELGHLKRMWGT